MKNIISPLKFGSILLISFFFSTCSKNSSSKITEQQWSIKTYPFNNPDPIPILTKDARLYPYHSFSGYDSEGTAKEWEAIKMENDHIEIYVLPGVGGKVWGAIDKKNGQEFIYKNEVLKFRNIALRGPWTSGGIEFNFGIIGHTPSAASSVDYYTRYNNDGSISTFVGAMDLPSRTEWRVEIKLEEENANFTTNAFWYNATPSSKSYYNWMTAAASAEKDLELIFPGDRYLKHSGEVSLWPIDTKKRDLSLYENNSFEGHKSYHVVGHWKNFFGGYYHSKNYGFGHWSHHDKMPGQKLWLWALSDEGKIWESHLTDNDGQYIEFQAGRQLVQFSPDDKFNPIKKASFNPLDTDIWSEVWFPVGNIGGIKEASKYGVMNVEQKNDSISIKLHSFVPSNGSVDVLSKNGNIIESFETEFSPRAVYNYSLNYNKPFKINVECLDLNYSYDRKRKKLDRSYSSNLSTLSSLTEVERKFIKANELFKERKYPESETILKMILDENSNHLKSTYLIADLYYRKAQYEKALIHIKKILSIDAYDSDANFIAGNIYKALNSLYDAKEAYGWASRSTKYKSAALSQISEIYLIEKKYSDAISYAKESLNYNRLNLNALEILSITNRILENNSESKKWIDNILFLDPLNHFARFELYLIDPAESNWKRFTDRVKNEFPEQTYLEIAISYFERNLHKEAKIIFNNLLSSHPLGLAWSAFIDKDIKMINTIDDLSIDFVHPFRRESIDILSWVNNNYNSWKWKYLLSLNLWAKNREKEALEILVSCDNAPNIATFYASRAFLKNKLKELSAEKDIQLSVKYAKNSPPVYINAIQFLQQGNDWSNALEISKNALQLFSNNFNIQILHAKSLLYLNELDSAIEILSQTNVLPSEVGKESHNIYVSLHLAKAIEYLKERNSQMASSFIDKSKKWPKNLGIGKPNEPDYSIQKIMMTVLNGKYNDKEIKSELKKLLKKYKGYKNYLIAELIALI
mgnify:CR=1 FL=1